MARIKTLDNGDEMLLILDESIELDGWLDHDGDMPIMLIDGGLVIEKWLTREDAMALVTHLTKVFKIIGKRQIEEEQDE